MTHKVVCLLEVGEARAAQTPGGMEKNGTQFRQGRTTAPFCQKTKNLDMVGKEETDGVKVLKK